LFGVAPALHVGRWEFGGRLRGAARGASAGRERRRMQAVLNVAQVAIAVILLAGAGLMIRTLMQLREVDAGFDPRGVVAIALTLSDARYPTDEGAIRFFARVVNEVKRVPGVRDAALVSDPPLTGGAGYWENGFAIEGRPPRPPGQEDFASLRWVTPDYFRTVGVPLVRGRSLADADALGRPLVVLVNEAMVRRHFPGEDPIGKRLVIAIRDGGPREIVGVAADYRQTALDDPPKPQMYVPIYQSMVGGATLLVRAEGSAESIAESVRVALRRVDPHQPVFNVRLMEQDVATSIAPRRLTMQALTVFAAIALGLALLGIYAVVAYQVGERTREIGVRVALGAHAADIIGMVVRQGLGPALFGVAAGLAGAAALSRVLSGLLYGVSAGDPVTYGATAAVMLLASLLACLVPARRAMRVDPSTALRAE